MGEVGNKGENLLSGREKRKEEKVKEGEGKIRGDG
jgi:hypothetical protein